MVRLLAVAAVWLASGCHLLFAHSGTTRAERSLDGEAGARSEASPISSDVRLLELAAPPATKCKGTVVQLESDAAPLPGAVIHLRAYTSVPIGPAHVMAGVKRATVAGKGDCCCYVAHADTTSDLPPGMTYGWVFRDPIQVPTEPARYAFSLLHDAKDDDCAVGVELGSCVP
jgi:hypothetical protein